MLRNREIRIYLVSLLLLIGVASIVASLFLSMEAVILVLLLSGDLSLHRMALSRNRTAVELPARNQQRQLQTRCP